MQIITKPTAKKLKENFEADSMQPCMKLFNPCGAQTWLVTKMDPDGDTIWVYADLGIGCVEYGTASLKEILSIKLPFFLKIERDRGFTGKGLVPSELLSRTSLSGVY